MEDIIGKVQKLLRKADSERNPNEHEAQAAMLKAQELLAKYGMSIADVDMSEEDDTCRTVIKSAIDADTKTAALWKGKIANVIAPNFRCKLYKTYKTTYTDSGRYRKGSDHMLIGLEKDVLICKEVIAFAFKSFQKTRKYFIDGWYRKNYQSRNRSLTAGLQNDYLDGYVSGLKAAFQKQVEEMALVITRHQLVDQAIYDLHLRSGGRSYSTRQYDKDAMGRGYEDGKRFDHSSVRSTPRELGA